ncbi:protein MALE DISCOVERER 2 [Sesamum angolense]|uniref:Protein MALE DISCOVERER 2 n=1 Tax=Sesamum angolense TaxID=2727404 RepID=A0AAE1WU56_9LAMI|nr:protein MALE DISCOVERER 2 [Sesamum angolense]
MDPCRLILKVMIITVKFRAKVDFDPFGALANWNRNDCNPCMWSGVECLDGKVVMLNLNGQELEGVLAPELGNLTHLRILDLSKSHLSGTIPPQFGQLTKLEVLDLRDNNLSGTVPAELGGLHSLKRLLLCNNRFEGRIPVEIEKLSLLTDLEFDDTLPTAAAAGVGCSNRKVGHCIWQSILKQPKKSVSFRVTSKWSITHYLNRLLHFKVGSESPHNHADDGCTNVTETPEPGVIQDINNQVNDVRRVLAEQSNNLVAIPPKDTAPAPSGTAISLPSRSSGSFPAVPNANKLSPPQAPSPPPPQENMPLDKTSPGAVGHKNEEHSSAGGSSGNSLKLIIGISSAVFLLIILAVLIVLSRSRAARTIGPWKSGLSGQLQKAFVTGVPKLNRDELETACEDFSNIIMVHEGVATLYKGTLSSGVEIAVASTAVASAKQWSKQAELTFRKKLVESESQELHKSYWVLREEEPFTRMMVFEYAPNGALFEHLHVEDLEHLDWNARMRIIMGTAYCLQHMHDLNPPVVHANLASKEIFLTDDYAAKIGDVTFWSELIAKSKKTMENDAEHSELPPFAVETNIHSFGILLLEIISGKLPYSEEEGDIVNWVSIYQMSHYYMLPYLNDKTTISQLIDPSLKSHKENELEVVCEVIQSCIQQDAGQRPSMKEIIQKLRQALDISPEAATPRLSPLWWAELEILSQEAA